MAKADKGETAIAWAAGIVDGEGCLDYSPRAKQIRLRVAMTHEPTLQRLAGIWDGKVTLRGPSARDRRAIWEVKITQMQELLRILLAIRPHSTTKRKEIDAVLQWLHWRIPRTRRWGTEDDEKAAKLYEKLRALKRGGQYEPVSARSQGQPRLHAQLQDTGQGRHPRRRGRDRRTGASSQSR